MDKAKFTRLLLQWHHTVNKREMPWKGEKDPYRIWLSEVILQQTRVEQGTAYYQKFIQKYPGITQLAKAKDEEVFKDWEGLGYYNRCKNLLYTARQISKENNGIFPTTYDTLLALKGVGPYTAAAIASFAYTLPYAVVDGNVFRVLSRVFGISVPIDGTEGKNRFAQLANEVLDKKKPGVYNQAIMDFGATICKPMIPICNTCPLRKVCVAFKEGKVNSLPVKEKVLTRKTRWFYYFLFEHEGKIAVHKRTGKDIWENLYEFYLVEPTEQLRWNPATVQQWLLQQFGIRKTEVVDISDLLTQQLTHRQIKGQFIKVRLQALPLPLQHYKWVPVKKLKQLAFPRFIRDFLDERV